MFMRVSSVQSKWRWSCAGRDGNFTRWYRYPWVSDLTGTGMGMKFYPRVVHIPDPRFGGYGHGYCLPPAGNPWISEIKLNYYLAQQRTGHSPRPKQPSPIRWNPTVVGALSLQPAGRWRPQPPPATPTVLTESTVVVGSGQQRDWCQKYWLQNVHSER
jgi:hypothetical protein